MNAFFRKLRWLTERSDKEADLREELQFHLEEEAEQRQADGLAEDEAEWAARRELGNLTLVNENTRAVWGWTHLEQVARRIGCRIRPRRELGRRVIHDAAVGCVHDGELIIEAVSCLAKMLLRESRQHLAGDVLAVHQDNDV